MRCIVEDGVVGFVILVYVIGFFFRIGEEKGDEERVREDELEKKKEFIRLGKDVLVLDILLEVSRFF